MLRLLRLCLHKFDQLCHAHAEFSGELAKVLILRHGRLEGCYQLAGIVRRLRWCRQWNHRLVEFSDDLFDWVCVVVRMDFLDDGCMALLFTRLIT